MDDVESILLAYYRNNGDFSKSDLKKMGLPCYNTLMRQGIRFTELKRKFSRLLYAENPKHCKWCGCVLEYEKRRNDLCSNSCSGHYSNTKHPDRKRGPAKGFMPSEDAIRKSKEGKLKTFAPFTKIRFCKVCTKVFVRTSNRLTCSKECIDSIVKRNRGRHKRSYMEESFSKWLDSFNVEYEIEYQIKNVEAKKCYYADFIFHDKMLIIELDGKQHEKTKEKDKIRDDFIRSLGYKVIRINHKEFKAKSRVEEISILLGI